MKKDLNKKICKKLSTEECDAIIEVMKQSKSAQSNLKKDPIFSKEYLAPQFSKVLSPPKQKFPYLNKKSSQKPDKNYQSKSFFMKNTYDSSISDSHSSLDVRWDSESSTSKSDSSIDSFQAKENTQPLKLFSKKTPEKNEINDSKSWKQTSSNLANERAKFTNSERVSSPSFRIPNKSPKFQIPEIDKLSKTKTIFQGWLKLAQELLDRLKVDFTYQKQIELANALSPFWKTPDDKLEKMIALHIEDGEEQLRKAIRTYTLIPNEDLKKWITEELNVSL